MADFRVVGTLRKMTVGQYGVVVHHYTVRAHSINHLVSCVPDTLRGERENAIPALKKLF